LLIERASGRSNSAEFVWKYGPVVYNFFIPRYLSTQVPAEWFTHLAFANDLIAALRPSLLVELGTVSGDSYFGFCQAVLEHGLDCACYSVLASADESLRLKSDNTHYEAFSYLLDSDETSGRFSENSIDLLHICPAANTAFDAWFPKVKPGGFVMIDGIESALPDQFAFHHGGGLGVLRKPGGSPLVSPLLQALLNGSAEEREYVRRHYAIYSELTSEVRAAQHERMFLETELTKTQFERNDSRRTLEQLQKSLAPAREASEAREIQLQEEIQRLNGLLQSEREVIQSLMHSSSWKATAPLRLVMEALRPHKKS
jgi:L-rhamnose mutarotase